jgi:hypothetical protein
MSWAFTRVGYRGRTPMYAPAQTTAPTDDSAQHAEVPHDTFENRSETAVRLVKPVEMAVLPANRNIYTNVQPRAWWCVGKQNGGKLIRFLRIKHKRQLTNAFHFQFVQGNTANDVTAG